MTAICSANLLSLCLAYTHINVQPASRIKLLCFQYVRGTLWGNNVGHQKEHVVSTGAVQYGITGKPDRDWPVVRKGGNEF